MLSWYSAKRTIKKQVWLLQWGTKHAMRKSTLSSVKPRIISAIRKLRDKKK